MKRCCCHWSKNLTKCFNNWISMLTYIVIQEMIQTTQVSKEFHRIQAICGDPYPGLISWQASSSAQTRAPRIPFQVVWWWTLHFWILSLTSMWCLGITCPQWWWWPQRYIVCDLKKLPGLILSWKLQTLHMPTYYWYMNYLICCFHPWHCALLVHRCKTWISWISKFRT